MMGRLDANPGMHIYHYGDYERSALQTMMGRHGTREAEVDRLMGDSNGLSRDVVTMWWDA